MFAQGIVDQSLIVATARTVNKAFEMLNDIAIKTDGNAYLGWFGLNNWAALAFTEIFTHLLIPIKY